MVDLIVRGAGVLGLTVAWEAAKRGLKVCISDPNGIASMASGGIVGALAPHVPENWNSKKQFQFQSLISAEKFWNNVDTESGFNSGYARLGRLQPIDDEKALLLARNRLESSKNLWCGVAKWRIIESSGPWSLTSRTGKWVFDNLSARINPTGACFSLARAIQKKGGVFETHLKKYPNIKSKKQSGKPTWNKKLSTMDDKIDPNKSLFSLFNKIRSTNYKKHQNFFYISGKRFYIRISKEKIIG